MLAVIVTYPKDQFGSTEDQNFLIQVPVAPDAPTGHVLNTVFRMMNRVDGSEIERYLKKYQCRSLSVGDIVEFPDERRFRCELVGWKEI